MAQTSQFWEGNSLLGTGIGDCGPYTTLAMANLLKAIFMGQNGVLEGLRVVQSSPAAKSVKVGAGKYVIRGLFYNNDSEITLAVADNTSGNPRIDRIILQCDWAAQTIRLAVLQGTPAVSPIPPTLTQTDGVIWQESLAQVQVANGFVTIVDANIIRERNWARADFPGLIQPAAGIAPSGWIICDGRAVSRTTYNDLFDAIGTSYGAGDGSTTFNVPDLRGRYPLGADNMGGTPANRVTATEADNLGQGSGAENHTLTLAQIPAHRHAIDQHTYSPFAATGSANVWTNVGGGTIYTDYQGGGQAHNNMPPYQTVNYYIRS